MTDLHPSVSAIMRYFEYGHLPSKLTEISQPCSDLAWEMATTLPQGPELTTGQNVLCTESTTTLTDLSRIRLNDNVRVSA